MLIVNINAKVTMMSSATITHKGQITIPKKVREALDLKAGDQVFFMVEGDRALMFPIRVRGLEHLRGVAGGRVPFISREAEREAAMREVARHALGLQDSDADSKD
jgi:AbrB family looped-hinge helix DNA binding protein